MFILIRTVICISRGRHEGLANVETYRDIQGQARTSRDKHGQTGTDREKEGQLGTERECPCLSLLVPA